MRTYARIVGVGALLLGLAACGDDQGADRAEEGTAARPAETGNDPVADSLVGRWIEAAGGLDRYRRIRSARFTLTTELYDTATGRLRRTRPRYVTIARTPAGELSRIERWEGDDLIRQGWDGETAWATMNGEPLSGGDMDYDQVRYVGSDVQYWISLPYKLFDPGVHLHYDGTDDDGRHDVRVTFGEGVGDHQDEWHYYFEPGRTWPAEVTYQEEGSDNVNRLTFQGIRETDDYVWVGRRVHHNERGQVWKVLRTYDMELDPELEEGVFSEPGR